MEAGRDTGLLPINSLLMDFEELPREHTPQAYASGLGALRALLDYLLDGPGKFDADSIRYLNDWHSRMNSILFAWERGGERIRRAASVRPELR